MSININTCINKNVNKTSTTRVFSGKFHEIISLVFVLFNAKVMILSWLLRIKDDIIENVLGNFLFKSMTRSNLAADQNVGNKEHTNDEL